ncbi:DUF6705 family protein [Hymenobacter sp. B81]|uniref:DUF6705 family protein n=1 Tax=Hymenobacter sp. B81 TaxID=3344878 RepID=UPI0037DC64B9
MLALLPFAFWSLLPASFAASSAPQTAPANPYVGLWEHRTDSTVFRVQLDEGNFRFSGSETHVVLLGRYSFSRRGVVVEETFSAPESGLPLGAMDPGYETGMTVGFQDQRRHNHISVHLQPKAGTRNVLLWKRKSFQETIFINNFRPQQF